MQFANVSNVELFTHGKRGLIYTGIYNGKKAAIKTKNPKSTAIGNIGREGECLKKLNRHGIGPMLMFYCENYFIYEFVDGIFLPEYVRISTIKDIKYVLLDVLRQCLLLDELSMNKEEMHHPDKHILVGKKVVMLDFERCKQVLRPQNVTQFVQYICGGLKGNLENKGFTIPTDELLDYAQKYKYNYDKRHYNKIIEIIQKF